MGHLSAEPHYGQWVRRPGRPRLSLEKATASTGVQKGSCLLDYLDATNDIFFSCSGAYACCSSDAAQEVSMCVSFLC